jgi:membrane protein
MARVTSKRFGRELLRKLEEDRVVNGAAALAFYWVLALFPAAIFLLTLLPYLPVANLEQAIVAQLHRAMPAQAADLFARTVDGVVSRRHAGLLSFGLLFALWSASSGTYAVMKQLDVTHDVVESRGFFKVRGAAILLTIAFVALVVVGFALVVFGGVLEDWSAGALGWSKPVLFVFALLRWIVIAFTLLFAIALLYKFGPDVERKFKLFTPGTVLATIGFAVAAFGFRVYVTHFARYDKIYGSLGAFIVLLLWLFVMGLVILVGSEIDALSVPYRTHGNEEPGAAHGSHPQPA